MAVPMLAVVIVEEAWVEVLRVVVPARVAAPVTERVPPVTRFAAARSWVVTLPMVVEARVEEPATERVVPMVAEVVLIIEPAMN